MRLKTALLAGCLALAAHAGCAQENGAAGLLARIHERWDNVKDYQATVMVGGELGGQKAERKVQVAFRRPDGFYFAIGDPTPIMIARSGQQRWVLVGAPGECVQRSVKPGEPQLAEFDGSLAALLGSRIAALDLLDGRGLTSAFAVPRLLADEKAGERDCHVIAVSVTLPQGPTFKADSKFYFEKGTLDLALVETTLALPAEAGATRGMRATLRQRYVDVKTDSGLPDETFVFKPPEGAKKVNQFGGPPNWTTALSGKPAPGFTIKSLSGQPVSLSYYKGKVLLLHFWASWCGPCRIEMPDLQWVYNEAKKKGVAFLGVSLDEGPQEARDFLKQQGLSLPSGFDPRGSDGIAKLYKVKGIPATFVITEAGRVAAGFPGMTPPEHLVLALQSVGVKIELPAGAAPSEERRWRAADLGASAARDFALGRFEPAGKSLQALVDLMPWEQTYWLLLADFLMKTRQPAAEALGAGVKAGQGSPVAHARAALLCLENGAEPKAALEHASEAALLEPGAAQLNEILGRACTENGMLDKAVAAFEKAVKADPSRASTRYYLGEALEKQDKKEEALRNYRAALNIDPLLDEAQQAVDRLAGTGS